MISLFTVGHSNHPIERFLELLNGAQINTLVDVLALPGSRRWPQYDQQALRQSVANMKIEYAWLPALGGRRKARADSKNTAWRNAAFRGYADYMETAEFEDGIVDLVSTATGSTACIMCSEALWWQCHRGLISDLLKTGGHRVLHILSDGRTQEHPYSSAARIVNGRLSYESEQGVLEYQG